MRVNRIRVFLLLALLVVAGSSLLLRPQVASAHPLGNFTINTLSIIELAHDEVSVRFVVDMAEIPTFQQMAVIDLDDDDQASLEERNAYLEATVRAIVRDLFLTINGSPVPLEAKEKNLEFLPGQGDLSTTRIAVSLRGEMPRLHEGRARELYFRNDSYPERLGWKEVVVKAGNGISLLDSTAPDADETAELTNYPEELIGSPPNHREARSTFVLTGTTQPGETSPTPISAQPTLESRGMLTSLITARRLSLPVVALALAVALGLGALHAASPGHGKTIMAAYLVGTRGTAKHALLLGVTVTISHTLGVVGLGLVVLFASHIIAPERLYPWLSLVSGALIIAIGAWLLASRMIGHQKSSHAYHDPETHTHSHSHSQDISSKSDLTGLFGQAKELGAKVFHGHSHDHIHVHKSPREGNRLRLTWQSLIALGIVGGLVPSASALIILLAAISLQRVGFGLVLILAFSAGMAAVLTSVGLALVYAGRFIGRIQFRNRPIGLFSQMLPVATALVVLLSGLVVAVRAMFQVGLV